MTRAIAVCVMCTAAFVTAVPAPAPARQAVFERLAEYQPGRTPAMRMTRDALVFGAVGFRDGGSAWIDGGPVADRSRRRLVVATYALDLLTSFDDRSLWGQRQPATALLEWACATIRRSDLVRATEEAAWNVAALALLERSGSAEVVRAHLDHAEARLAKVDDWKLARAIADEMESQARRRDDGSLSIPRTLVSKAAQHFELAAKAPSTRQQALIRWAAFESDLGDQNAALARLADSGPLEARVLKYWYGLVRGRALERANRRLEAIAEYRQAAAEFPGSQAASLSLAAALLDAEHPIEASSVVASAIRFSDTPEVPFDPWDFYRAPDVLRWAEAFEILRRAVVQ